MQKVNYKKLKRVLGELIEDMNVSHPSELAQQCAVQELILKNGRKAQIYIMVNCDEDTFDEVVPD